MLNWLKREKIVAANEGAKLCILQKFKVEFHCGGSGKAIIAERLDVKNGAVLFYINDKVIGIIAMEWVSSVLPMTEEKQEW